MKKLAQRIKKWFIQLLTELKDDLINAAHRQWYIVVMVALIVLASNNLKYGIGVICIVAFVVMFIWIALVKLTVVEPSDKK